MLMSHLPFKIAGLVPKSETIIIIVILEGWWVDKVPVIC